MSLIRRIATRIPAGLWVPLLLAIVVRAALWGNLPRTGLISDEGEYLAAATWLAEGRGFDWYQGYLWTRAPLYPLFVAAHLRLFGPSLDPIFLTQTLLSLLNVALVYALGVRLTEPRNCGTTEPSGKQRFSMVSSLAAGLTAVFLPLAVYTQTLLSETLFITLMLAALLALAGNPRSPRHAMLAGLLLGLATLTRSLALGFLPLAALWMLLYKPQNHGTTEPIAEQKNKGTKEQISHRQSPSATSHQPPAISYQLPANYRPSSIVRLRAPIALLLAAALIILPWTVFNSRMYGGLVAVDTSGAFNLLLGARTAYDGKRSDAQVRDYVLGLLGQPTSVPAIESCVQPYPGVLASQAERQATMSREGLCLIGERPVAFVQKSVAELVDLFQINYTGAERFTSGFSTGRLPPLYVLALFVLDDTLYVLALPLAILGWALARRSGQAPALVGFVGLWWIFNVGIAPLLFAINRFRIPLMPLLFVFAAYALIQLTSWAQPSTSASKQAGSTFIGFRSWVLGLGSSVLGLRSQITLVPALLLAVLLFLVAATPYAYLEPRGEAEPSRWASYLGPYPSSLDITLLALSARPHFENDQRFAQALAQDDREVAQALLAAGNLGLDTTRLGPALLAGRRGQPTEGLSLLPQPAVIAAEKDALAAVVRGDLLRTLGDQRGALDTLSARFVEDANPVSWAWEWLRPAPTAQINLGGSLDIGYIDGCYLGEGDTTIEPAANFRWCTDGARLRFPEAADGQAQSLVLRADGRAWASYASHPPAVSVLIDGRIVGQFTPDSTAPREFTVALPPLTPGADIVITLRTATFVPDAARYNRQQSEAVSGQVQRLGVRLDWAEIR
jgi:4-amino-4-deoxy-L-arabinose transferase-like glycosyltransferase